MRVAAFSDTARGWRGWERSRGGRASYIAAVCASVLIFLAGMGASLFLPAFFGFAWRGYYTVLLDAKADVAGISQDLERRGFQDFISAATARVEISGYDRMEEFPLEDIHRRFPQGDPRMDSFLQGAPALFRSESSGGGGEKRHILYFPATQSPFVLAWKLAPVLGDYSWTIVEWHTGRRVALLALFCAIVALCAYFYPRPRRAAFILALPWLNFLIHADPAVFAAGVFVYFAFVYLAEKACACFDYYLFYGEGRIKPALRNFIPQAAAAAAPLATAAGLAAVCGAGSLRFVSLLCGITGSLALAAVLALHRRYAHSRREHRLFMPLPVLPRKWKGNQRGRTNPAPLVLALSLMAVPCIFMVSGTGLWLIPKPHEVPGLGGFSRENLRQLWASGRGGSIPGFSDYLCHRAFQKGFFYGYPEEFPLPDVKITLPRYLEENGVLKRTEQTLLTFDEIWYKEELERAEKPGIGNLLLRQGIAEISLETAWRLRIDSAWVVRYALIITAGFLVFLLVRAGASLNLQPGMKNFKIGRNQQEA
ncbi:MAG: hypothetical protein LBK13_03130 [Spirochaetales bacterium]|jgi:hypothetical protein|nr:hypothetical protein [Spirochaetales bacterium]